MSGYYRGIASTGGVTKYNAESARFLALGFTACPQMQLKCNFFMAPSFNNCVLFTETCDDMNDCPDGEDETLCDGESTYT